MIRKTPILVTLAGALLLLSACGGSSTTSSASADPSSSAVADTTTSADAGDFAAFRECMSENGVDLPTMAAAGGAPPSGMPTDRPTGAPPSGGPEGGGPVMMGRLPDGVDQETFDAAQEACGSLAPQGRMGMRGGPGVDESALVAFKSCLTDHDVAVSEDSDWMRTLDRSDPTVQEAFDTCEPLLPTPSAPSAPSP